VPPVQEGRRSILPRGCGKELIAQPFISRVVRWRRHVASTQAAAINSLPVNVNRACATRGSSRQSWVLVKKAALVYAWNWT
jgi:hypothetical protein